MWETGSTAEPGQRAGDVEEIQFGGVYKFSTMKFGDTGHICEMLE